MSIIINIEKIEDVMELIEVLPEDLQEKLLGWVDVIMGWRQKLAGSKSLFIKYLVAKWIGKNVIKLFKDENRDSQPMRDAVVEFLQWAFWLPEDWSPKWQKFPADQYATTMEN